jgi:hypothetical protein
MQRRKQHPLEYLARLFRYHGNQHIVLRTAEAGTGQALVPQSRGREQEISVYGQALPCLHALAHRRDGAHVRRDDSSHRRRRSPHPRRPRCDCHRRTLGALLIQFPVSFKNTSLNREYLDRLLRQFIEYPRVVEVRDSSWNNAETLAAFTQKNVGFCNIDQPVLGRSLAPTEHVTGAIGYVRLHGRNYEQWFDSDNRNDRYNYLYSEKELAGWKERIESVASGRKPRT